MRLLLLGGGGTLGAFSAGALEVLWGCGWKPDAWIGSSAGGINLLRQYGAGPSAPADFWRAIGPMTVLRHMLSHNPFSNGLLNAHRFLERVDEGVDYEKMFRDERLFGFIVVDLETGRVRVRSNRTETSPAALQAVAHGAFSLPPLLPPVRWESELLSDGGLLHNAPLDVAVELGATEIIYLCNVHALPREGFDRPSTARSAARYAEVFFRRASNVGFADAEILEDRYRGIPFLTIAPPPDLGVGSTLRWMLPTVNAMGHLVEQGRLSALRALERTHMCNRARAEQKQARASGAR